jgi:hypothetical protein
MKSNFLTLNWVDFGKGLLVSVISAVLGVVTTSLQAGSLTFDWKVIGTVALSAGLAYITKNFFSNSSGQVLTKEVDPTTPPKG